MAIEDKKEDENLNEDDKKKIDDKKADDKKAKDPEYLESELNKVIQQRDEVKKERRKLLEELETLKTKVSASPTQEEVEGLKKQFEDLKAFREDVEKQKEEDELKKKSELERTQIQYNKELEKIKKEMQDELAKQREILQTKEKETESIINKVKTLTTYKLEGEIIKAATKYKALNPNQIYKLLKDEFNYNETLDKFEYLKYDTKNQKLINELDVEERVKEFLSLEENDNLVEANVKKGTGNVPDNQNFKNKKFDVSQTKYDPTDSDLIRQAELKGMTVEDHIKTLVLRDEKLKNRK